MYGTYLFLINHSYLQQRLKPEFRADLELRPGHLRMRTVGLYMCLACWQVQLLVLRRDYRNVRALLFKFLAHTSREQAENFCAKARTNMS